MIVPKKNTLPTLEATLKEIDHSHRTWNLARLTLKQHSNNLTRHDTDSACTKKTLQQAELKVNILLKKNGAQKLDDYGHDES